VAPISFAAEEIASTQAEPKIFADARIRLPKAAAQDAATMKRSVLRP